MKKCKECGDSLPVQKESNIEYCASCMRGFDAMLEEQMEKSHMSTEIIDIERYAYAGYHHTDKNSECRVQVARVNSPNGMQYALVVFTELPDNPGTSVTNRTEVLATEIVKEYGIDPDGAVFLEHYPQGEVKKTLRIPEYSRVTYQWENGAAKHAKWEYIPLAEAQALGLLYGVEL